MKDIRSIVRTKLIPMLQALGEMDNPGIVTRKWLKEQNFDSDDVAEIATYLAISYRAAFQESAKFERWYREGRVQS